MFKALSVALVLGTLLLAPTLSAAQESEFSDMEHQPSFSENKLQKPSSDWKFDWHGYLRMPVRFHGSPLDARPPYLVDDDYYLSGFAYTRVNETEWAEFFLNAQKDKTRLVVGLFSSKFSDWSETTLQGQGGVATAFVEHEWDFGDDSYLLSKVGIRAGMFWERFGYINAYDTYLFGRTHAAGLALQLTLADSWMLRGGYGAHADVINANQGFTPVAWARFGFAKRWLDAGLYALKTWTTDSKREFSIVEDGDLRVLGADLRATVPYLGPIHLGVAHYKAKNVLFLANSFELLHSTGGRGLTTHFFGPDSESGTGEILVTSFDVNWQPWRSVGGGSAEHILRPFSLRFFGMSAWVLSEQQSDDPSVNRHDRHYFKWGSELMYRPKSENLKWLFGGLRYDRIILDMDHESLSFRMITPRIGVTPTQGMEIFLSYSKYFYGDNIRLRPNQVPGDLSVTQPDDSTFKLQAQVSW